MVIAATEILERVANSSLRDELRSLSRYWKPRRLRTMREFAEQEIILPTGPSKNWKFSVKTQPFAALWFAAVESGKWNRFAATGCQQSGKTLLCFIIPILYHLFEIGETVVVGVPNGAMAKDKWIKDLLPVIMKSQKFKAMLPKKGAGSQGGYAESITFTNGATLRFMTGGGDDKSVAGFTTRIVVITETDGMDAPGETSREADRIAQLEGRTRAYNNQKRIYMECTVSIEEGRTWQEYTKGTESRIVMPCPKCFEWVSLERDSLVNWKQGETIIQAENGASYSCPKCGEFWTENERKAANYLAKLLHRGQKIGTDGAIEGPSPETHTLGFRWTAGNNFLCDAKQIGGEEWTAAQSDPDGSKEKALRQFVWAIPSEPDRLDDTPIDEAMIRTRQHDEKRGIPPAGTCRLAVGVDVGKHYLHFSVISESAGPKFPLIDYGIRDVMSTDMDIDVAILKALRDFKTNIIDFGWLGIHPDEIWIDSGYEPEAVYAFCRESGAKYRPTKGHGAQRWNSSAYSKPAKIGPEVRFIGEGYHLSKQHKAKLQLVHIDADYWKTKVHQRLTSPISTAGALTLFNCPPVDHSKIARQLTSEKKVEIFEKGVGTVTRWEQTSKANHFFDSTAIALACLRHLGSSVIVENHPAPQPEGWYANQTRR